MFKRLSIEDLVLRLFLPFFSQLDLHCATENAFASFNLFVALSALLGCDRHWSLKVGRWRWRWCSLPSRLPLHLFGNLTAKKEPGKSTVGCFWVDHVVSINEHWVLPNKALQSVVRDEVSIEDPILSRLHRAVEPNQAERRNQRVSNRLHHFSTIHQNGRSLLIQRKGLSQRL